MKTRVFATGSYVGAFVLLLPAVALMRPADLVQFFFGFFAPPLVVVQLGFVAVGVVLVLLAVWLDSRNGRRRRLPVAAFAIGALAALSHATWRELAAYSRDSITVAAGENRLDGVLYVPRGSSPRPAVLILHGSGPVSRNAYHFVADRLARSGRIVLNLDKRGVGRSTGQYYGDDTGQITPLERRADDAAAALAFLRRDPRVDGSNVGVFGISQGGWVFPLLAQRDSAMRFAVMLSGPAVSTGEEETYSDLTNENADHFGRNPPPLSFEELDRRIRATAPTGYDPRRDLPRIRTPTLWLFGDWDTSLPVDASVRVLDSLRAAGSPFTVRRFAEANHGLFVVRGPNAKALSRFAPGVWDTVDRWLDEHAALQTARVTAR